MTQQVRQLSDVTASHVLRQRAHTFAHLQILSAWYGRAGAAERMQRGGYDADLLARAAVGAHSTDSLAAATTLANAFVENLKPRTIIGALGGAVRLVPPDVLVPTATSTATAYWKAEGKPAPVTKYSTATATLGKHSLVVIVPFSTELIRRGGPTALALAERELTRAIVVGSDVALLDAAAAVAGQRPASVLYGVEHGLGSPAVDTEAGVGLLWSAVSGGASVAPFFVVSPTGAAYLATLRSGGARVFPDVGVTGGSIWGVPLLVSPAALSKLALVDADAILLLDLGIDIGRSDEATVEMLDTALQQNGLTGAGAAQVSAFQSGLTLLKAERSLDWALGRADGAGYITLPV
jgi:HK97 family phage major capsid protein